MAWYAELKRKKWYCINGINMPYLYKKHLYDEWYNSLTEEQKQTLEENRRKQREKDERELQQSLMRIAALTGYYRSKMPDKYHGVYDAFGFPTI